MVSHEYLFIDKTESHICSESGLSGYSITRYLTESQPASSQSASQCASLSFTVSRLRRRCVLLVVAQSVFFVLRSLFIVHCSPFFVAEVPKVPSVLFVMRAGRGSRCGTCGAGLWRCCGCGRRLLYKGLSVPEDLHVCAVSTQCVPSPD